MNPNPKPKTPNEMKKPRGKFDLAFFKTFFAKLTWNNAFPNPRKTIEMKVVSAKTAPIKDIKIDKTDV